MDVNLLFYSIKTKFFKSELYFILTLYILSVIFKIILAFLFALPTPITYFDEIIYAKGAESFINSANLAFQGESINIFPPLYSIIISLAYLLKDPHAAYFAITLLNAIILSTIIFPIWLLAKMFLNRNEALIVTILIGFFLPLNYTYIFVIMSENLFIPLIALSILFLLKSIFNPSLKYDALCGFLFGLAYLTKNAGIVLLPLYIICFGIFCIFAYRDSHPDIKLVVVKIDSLKWILKGLYKKYLVFLIFILTILPWYIRNTIYFAPSKSTLITRIMYGITGRYGTYGDDIGIMNLWGSLSLFTFQEISRQFFLHLSYIILSLNVVLFLFIGFLIVEMVIERDVISKNKKLFLFSFSIVILLFSFLLITAIHVYFYNIAYPEHFKYLRARYVDPIIPLLILLGFIGIQEFNKNKYKYFSLPIIIIIISGSILLFFPPIYLRAPLNTIMIQYLGTLTYFEYYLIILLIFVIIFLIIFFIKKITFNGIAAIFAILFIFSSISAYSMIAWSSNTQYTSDQNEIISWINQQGLTEETEFIINNQTTRKNAQYLANALSFFTHAKFTSGIVTPNDNSKVQYYISDTELNYSFLSLEYKTDYHYIYAINQVN